MRFFHHMTRLSPLLAILLLGSGNALALRCGSHLVAEGDTKLQVLGACGEPDYKEWIGYREIGPDTVRIESWFYDFGSLRFTQTLTFHGSRLIRIEAGDYGDGL